MIGYILVSIAFLGSSIAAYFDIKTTEVPDLIAIGMAILGVTINTIYSYITHNSYFIISALIVGGIFSALGALQYYTKMWGGADFLILGALGFLIPYVPKEFNFSLGIWPFPVTFLINTFLIGAAYTILYALFLAFRKKGILKLFLSNLIKFKKGLFYFTFGYLLFSAFFIFLVFFKYSSLTLNLLFTMLHLFPYFLLLLILYVFLKTLQYDILDRKISTNNLKEGDVLAEKVVLKDKIIPSSRIVGLTKKQVSEIKREKKYVKITQGVPYIPVFPLTILITFIFGDLISKIVLLMVP